MKFFNLLKKELKDLLNLQMFLGLIISVGILLFMGSFMGGVMDKALNSQSITLCDMDDTEFTKDIISKLKADGNEVKLVDVEGEDYPEIMKNLDASSLIIIPEGFTEKTLTNHEPGELKLISKMSGTSISSTIEGTASSDTLDVIKQTVTDSLMKDTYNLTSDDLDMIQNPIDLKEYTVVNGKSAEAPISLVTSTTMMQSIVIPIVIFILVMMASQMIVTAISTEKIDKTLETLLSTPVSRISVLSAKMLAATIIAILNAAIYMVGFGSYMGGMIGGATMNGVPQGMSSAVSSDIAQQAMGTADALVKLGLTLTPAQYVLVGIQMFLTIMIALSISFILGSMAKDIKSSQTVILPVMFAAMIPYMISIFSSVNDLPIVFKTIMFLIPFTHTYTAMENLMFGNMTLYWIGLIYQVIALIICMLLAVRLFTTDKLFTMSFNMNRGKKKTIIED